MKKRKLILIVNLVIIVLLVVTLIIVKNNKHTNVPNNDNQDTVEENIKNSNVKIEDSKYTEIVDGIKRNNSEKLHETKKIGNNISVENVNLIYKENKTTMVLIMKNNANDVVGDYDAKIILKNSKGEIIEELDIYINHIEAGKTASIVASITRDVTGAYDYEISR